jgi:GNAT superfamily N-acetyltransferase
MSASRVRTRYEAAQIVEAVDRARGDGRYFLVSALLELPAEQHEDALGRVLEMDLRPDERQMVLARLARLRPTKYLPLLIQSGLRSRSINVQQMAVAVLPDLVGEGLPPDLGEQVEGWLRRRLANPRRGGTWAMWEIPSAALALLPSYGTDRIASLITAIESKMQPDERNTWLPLKQVVNDRRAFEQGLIEWRDRNGSRSAESDPRDATADVHVDRAMKRLGYRPANPDSQVYDSLADSDVPTFVFDVRGDHGPAGDADRRG